MQLNGGERTYMERSRDMTIAVDFERRKDPVETSGSCAQWPCIE